MNTIVRWMAAAAVAALVAGCEEPDTDKREVRVQNDSATAVRVLIDDAEAMVVAGGKKDAAEVDDGLHEIVLQSEEGRVLWTQYVDLDDGQYARFVVATDGSVAGSGGLTYDPEDTNYYYDDDHLSDPELRLSNHFGEPVHIWIDGVERKVVAPGDLRSVDPGGGMHSVEFKTGDGRVLFAQQVKFKDGQYLLYTLERDGSVVVSGGFT